MQILALKEDYTISNMLNPTNVQWTRHYYECGAFSIQIPYNQYNDEMAYIYSKDKKELGIIRQVNYSISDQGYKAIQLSGYFLENMLDDKLVYPQFEGKGNMEDELIRMINEYKSDIDIIVPESQSRDTDTEFTSSQSGLATELYRILRLHEYSFSTSYNLEDDTKALSIWQGLDRTQEQSENNPITFSTAFKNIKNPNVVLQKNAKNFAIVKGNYNGSDVFVEVDLSDGKYQRQVFIDGSSVESENITSLDTYKEKLSQYGKNELINNYVEVNNIAFDVDPTSYEYTVDYDLGDKCTVIIEDINLVLEARIISIYEVYKDNGHEITLEFGNQKIKKGE